MSTANAYEVVCSAARFLNNPRASLKSIKEVLGVLERTLGAPVPSHEELKKAFREFKSAQASRVTGF